MRERRSVTALAAGKRGEKRGDATAEIYWQAEDCAELNDDGIHLPVAVRQADVQQRLRKPEVRRRTDRQKLRQAFDNPQQYRQQVVVQSSSEQSGNSVSEKVKEPSRQWSVSSVAVGWDSLLNVEDQPLGARGPFALPVLAHNFLRESQSAIFRFRGFLLIGLGPIDFDQSRAAPGGVVQGLRRGGRFRMIFRVVLVYIRLLVRTFRQTFPIAPELVFEQAKTGQIGPLRSGIFLDDQFHPLFVHL